MISVIIPAYNAESYLCRMLDSMSKQTYTNYEMIIVDDGSSDKTGIICDKAAQKDCRICCIHQQNAGVSAARNRALSEIKGEYVTFLDADDEVPANYLEELYRCLEVANADIAVCDVSIVKDEKELRRFSHGNAVEDSFRALELLLIRQEINSGPCAKLFRRKVIGAKTFPNFKTYEDILFVKDILCNARTVAFTNKTEYIYIQNEGSAMDSFVKIPSEDVIKVTEHLCEFIGQRKGISQECLYATLSHLYQYVIPLLGTRSKSGIDFIKRARKVFFKYWRDMVSCEAFPWKEKILYSLFAFGITH